MLAHSAVAAVKYLYVEPAPAYAAVNSGSTECAFLLPSSPYCRVLIMEVTPPVRGSIEGITSA